MDERMYLRGIKSITDAEVLEWLSKEEKHMNAVKALMFIQARHDARKNIDDWECHLENNFLVQNRRSKPE